MIADATDEVEGDPIDAKIVVMGDLNIDGNPFHSYASTCLDTEWEDAFSASSLVSFPGCADLDPATCAAKGRVLVDAWAFTTSPDDLGRTSTLPFTTDLSDTTLNPEGKRLDYVLVTGPVGPRVSDAMVPQHLTIHWPIAGEIGELSDHLPVGVDLLLPGPDPLPEHSTPVTAASLNVPANGDDSVSLEIVIPGQMQWTKLDGEPGTYSVDLSTTAVAFDLYAPTDLSRPLEPRRESTDRRGGWVYALTSPPYFVRTWAVVPGFREHDRTATETYTLSAREHDCSSPFEACLLTAGEVDEPVEVEWPAGTPVNAEDSLYFEFYADDPDVQARSTFHEFEIGGDGVSPLPILRFDALDLDDFLPLPDTVWSDLVIDGDRVARRADQIVGNPGATPSFANHLLTVTRDPSDLAWGGTTRVLHRTNLTYFTPVSIEVLQEYDDSAHDELRIYLEPVAVSAFHDTVDVDDLHEHASEFHVLPQIEEVEDGGSPWPAKSLGSLRLTEELPLLMLEDNDEDGDDEEGDFLFAEPHPGPGLGTSTDRALAVLALDRTHAHAIWVFTDDTTVADDDTDYRYRFVFDVSHTPPCFTTCN